MAELNLNQIIERLNAEFTADSRKLVFWYDDKAEFADDIDSVELKNAKVYKLTETNQFYTKRFLEREDTKTNYLVYAPFPKPDVKENHLEDIILYSKRFYADRASLIMVDLKIEDNYKPIIEKYIKFFSNKDRTQKFYDLEIEKYNEDLILLGMLSVICKSKTCSFEEILRVVLTDELQNSKYLSDMETYDLLSTFWVFCDHQFGYTDKSPTLEKLVISLFVTYTGRSIKCDLPSAWKSFMCSKSGNVIAFMDNLMNNIVYKEQYDELVRFAANHLKVSDAFKNMSPEDLIDCDLFVEVDSVIAKWINDRLVSEDLGAKLADCSIMDVCAKRSKMHYAEKTKTTYHVFETAYTIIEAGAYEPAKTFSDIIQRYLKEDYKLDQAYRKFYYYYGRPELNQSTRDSIESLRQLVERIYTNEYLSKIMPAWNEGLKEESAWQIIPKQTAFYNKYIRTANERTVVIISDAMRYEVAQELFKKMQDNQNCTADIKVQMSVLPSYTKLGMAAILPHKQLTMTDDYKIRVDDGNCEGVANRDQILRKYNPASACVQFDEVKDMNRDALRGLMTGKEVVYIYHNQIDARGDNAKTENEVFDACAEAINEIINLIKRINGSANTHRFIITSDHGFIYKHDKLTESDKIGGVLGKDAEIGRRYIVAKSAVIDDGIQSVAMSRILDNDDDKVVSFPISSNIFKVIGGGSNFVHGGSSPQEMLVPIVDLKMDKSHVDVKNAEIALVSMIQKITNLIVTMDFIQSDAVSDTVKKTKYKLSFKSEDGELISNENSYVADNRDKNAQNRMFRLRFEFKNQKYEKNKQYYLTVVDEATGLELFRHPVIMDLAFADDFGF